ncbi:MAG: 50S ribosomal protein L11 [Patescibacteria group bacterium]|nr:50S ribosomal protein L11 [Patescibacteria group bacterium]MDP4030737.1 50S ribosomal protein L11 [Candidatus Beckwithbacteria bacterium]MDZ4229294.1 50S ribosomal protein L11 [Patescibacteria group bacterium]
MAKKVKVVLKLNLPAGKANPAPPIGPALGQHGIAIMEFCKAYNERTKTLQGVIPALITIYEDRSFEFVLKKPPVSELIKKELKLEKGSQTPGRETIATLKSAQVEKIAQEKMDDLNANDIEAAKKIVAGTARSMGIKVE